ncbi:MAG TPA: hypothetical protein PLA83_09210 [Deltaproteobacteria bacterium]|jgi:hypothetical protein|nr:hypothetical protein [Deltaproteobacteria bacterium]HQI00272.1 hypothetical protein [Deltaproteobacteria bacterium]HQJ10000.1 hypothetical protein [Deltaproteobacteria bacterium]
MKKNRCIGKYIDLIRDLFDEVSSLLADQLEREPSVEWKDKADSLLTKILGEDHPYVHEFHSIEFSTSFMEEYNEIVVEETYRLGLEDARSFLSSLIDELESESTSTPGLMDMESLFAEMSRYVSAYVEDASMRDSLYFRITRLRDGMISGDISGAEVKNHMEHIGYLDMGLFERMVPFLTWYYMQRVGFNGARNN